MPAFSHNSPTFTAERLKDIRAQTGSPALATASVHGSQSPQLWVDGERAAGSGIAVTEDDLWHFGSITKSMTATLVGHLIDSGDLRWDDTVGDMLDAVVPGMIAAYRPVTFRHLLSHRSGLPNDIPGYYRFSQDITDARDERRTLVRRALAMPPKGPMETTFEYSNNGYVVAGAMLEAKFGESWESLMRTHLFEPLKLQTAGFGAPGREGAIDQPLGHSDNLPSGARPHHVGSRVADIPVVLGPAGRVHMSLRDMLSYLMAHRDRSGFLDPQTWTTLHTPPFGGEYAMGWLVRPDGALWHNGSNLLWYAEAFFDTASGVAATAACNDGNRARSAPAVRRALLEAAATCPDGARWTTGGSGQPTDDSS
jgi:CubicO group peptidase (beta-lactamase class C family)